MFGRFLGIEIQCILVKQTSPSARQGGHLSAAAEGLALFHRCRYPAAAGIKGVNSFN
jgi:hypothetical protein